MVRYYIVFNGNTLWFLASQQSSLSGFGCAILGTHNYSYVITDKQLIVKQGRVARTKYINIADITNISKLPLAFRIGSYVLIELKNGKVVSLQPHNCKAFITAIHNLL